MLTQAAHATQLSHQPDIVLPLRGKRADETSSLGALGIVMSFGRNTEIYAESEPAGNVYKVVSGVVRISKLLPDGRRQISAFHSREICSASRPTICTTPRPKRSRR